MKPVVRAAFLAGPPDEATRLRMEEAIRTAIEMRETRCSFCTRPPLPGTSLKQGWTASICSQCAANFCEVHVRGEQFGNPDFASEGTCSITECGHTGRGWAMGMGIFICESHAKIRLERAKSVTENEGYEAAARAYRSSQSCAFCQRVGEEIKWVMGGVGRPISICGDCLGAA